MPCFKGWMCTWYKDSPRSQQKDWEEKCQEPVYGYIPSENGRQEAVPDQRKKMYVNASFDQEPGAVHTCGSFARWSGHALMGDYYNVVYDLNKQLPYQRSSIQNGEKVLKLTSCLGHKMQLACRKGESIVFKAASMGRHRSSRLCASCNAQSNEVACIGHAQNNVLDMVSAACKDSQVIQAEDKSTAD